MAAAPDGEGDPIILPRVLIFSPLFHPVVGGAERQAELLARLLLENGVAAEVLTVRMEADWPLTETRPGGVHVRRIPFNDICREFPHIRGLGVLNTFLLRRQVVREVKALADRFDVLHAFNASQPSTAFAVRTARAANLSTIVRTVSTREWFDLTVLGAAPIWGRITRRWLLRDTDRWIAISAAAARDLAATGIAGDRIRRLPNGVTLPESPAEIPVVATRFLYLGRLAATAPRDISGVIIAFERVASECPEAELALVGSGDQLESVRKLAAASRAAARIHVPGHGDGDFWRSWAHCFVQPSFVEGMSNALLEGMASGLPCIAYDIEPNREALGDGSAGILVPVSDHDALASAMRRLAIEAGVARELGRQARARAESVYDMRRIAKKTIELYGDLLAGRTIPSS